MMVELIYCADGNKRFAKIAIQHGFTYGAQMPNRVYFTPEFVDQNWKAPDFAGYVKSVRTYRPRLATVLDFERPDQFLEVMRWSQAIAGYVERIIIIPKFPGAVAMLPKRIGFTPVRLGYSVPTSYGKTDVSIEEFGNWEVHLLGGSAPRQLELTRVMNVASIDNSQIQQHANANRFYWNGRRALAKNASHPSLSEMGRGDIDKDAPYAAFALSLANINAAMIGAPVGIRYATEHDIEAIQTIARQHNNELGFVMNAKLKEGIAKCELIVALYGSRVVGFAHWHARRDGFHTLYTIAVHHNCQSMKIGSALLASVPRPMRLKCTADNSANEFYQKQGLKMVTTEAGRKRELNVWEAA